LVVHIDLDVDL